MDVFFNDTATTEIYTLSLHDALPISLGGLPVPNRRRVGTTSSHHGPYAQGHTRATMAGTAGREFARTSQSPKAGLSADRGLQPAHVKLESLVIVDRTSVV